MKIMMIIKQASSRNILQSEREKKFCYLHQLKKGHGKLRNRKRKNSRFFSFIFVVELNIFSI